MKKSLTLSYLMVCFCAVQGQTDSTYTFDYIDRSTRFAWLTLGFETFREPGGTTGFVRNGNIDRTSFEGALTPRLTIGGIHFWGHADFYVTFPLNFATIRNNPNGFETLKFSQGIETGARFYPLKLKSGRFSPFMGISFNTFNYRQLREEDDFSEGAPVYQQVIAPLEAGFTYTTGQYHITASAYYNSIDKFDYAISTSINAPIEIDPLSFSLRIYKYWDTDKGMRSKRVLGRLNRYYNFLEKENQLNAWYWGIGPSAGIQISKSSYLENNFPFLENDRMGGFMPDITFGRYLSKPDMNIGFSYRTLGDRLKGFDTEIKVRRHSAMIEVYKNVFDWLGFVPFVGVTMSMEYLSSDINGNKFSDTKAAVGLIAGWDIRVTKTGSSLLRTNLRWIPDLHLQVEGDKIMFNQLEFNFIQYVHFIGRKKAYERFRKR
ncbi:MAG: hypothetical protein AAGF85_10055 [Bacteroidota bacterium]